MKILITGATGFLGGRLCTFLKDSQFDVVATGRNRAVGRSLEAHGIPFVPLDLAQESGWDAVPSDIEGVVHTAALSSSWGSWDSHYRANYTTTRNLLDHLFGKRSGSNGRPVFIHISTPSVSFQFRDQLNVGEVPPTASWAAGTIVDPYAATKGMAEDLVLSRLRESGHGCILRPRAMFGPGDTTLLPRLVRVSRKLGGVPFFRRDCILADLTYIDNVCEVIAGALRNPIRTRSPVYNVTNGEPGCLQEAVSNLLRDIGEPHRIIHVPYGIGVAATVTLESVHRMRWITGEPLLTRYAVGLLRYHQTLDITKARRELGYDPSISLAEGLRRTAEWYRREHRERA